MCCVLGCAWRARVVRSNRLGRELALHSSVVGAQPLEGDATAGMSQCDGMRLGNAFALEARSWPVLETVVEKGRRSSRAAPSLDHIPSVTYFGNAFRARGARA
jgi:hypothetical protein